MKARNTGMNKRQLLAMAAVVAELNGDTDKAATFKADLAKEKAKPSYTRIHSALAIAFIVAVALAIVVLFVVLIAQPAHAGTTGPGDDYLQQIADQGVENADTVPAAKQPGVVPLLPETGGDLSGQASNQTAANREADRPGDALVGDYGTQYQPVMVARESDLLLGLALLAGIVLICGLIAASGRTSRR